MVVKSLVFPILDTKNIHFFKCFFQERSTAGFSVLRVQTQGRPMALQQIVAQHASFLLLQCVEARKRGISRLIVANLYCQWLFQEPNLLDVPTVYKAYVKAM